MNHSCHHKNIFKKRFYICLILTIPVLLLSPMIQSFFHINISFWSDKYLLFAFSTIIFIYGGYPFLSGMFYEIKNKMPGMMTLISLAILVAYFYSSSVIFFIKGKLFFWELATLIDIMLLGHWIEMKSITSALGALEELSKLIPSEAHVILDDGTIKNVPTKQLQIGHIVLIKPGEQIPCDGKVVDGQSDVNESLITGESKPVFKEKDMKIIAGTINETGSLTIIVDKTEKESYISKVIQLVKTASESKSKAQTIADKAAFILTIISISVGILTLISWIIIQHDFVFALERMVTVMIITCPHALGLAIPLVIAIVTSLSAKNGLLIKNRAAFENAFKMNSFVFDKTGTLTKGKFEVSDIFSINNFSEENILKYAASLDILSEHSIAKAIVSSAKDKNIDLMRVKNFKALPGIGASCKINNDHILLKKYNFKDFSNDQTKKFLKEKKTIISLFINNKIQGIITLKDSLRDESISIIKYLKSKKFKLL